jgi:hypothetical protein
MFSFSSFALSPLSFSPACRPAPEIETDESVIEKGLRSGYS